MSIPSCELFLYFSCKVGRCWALCLWICPSGVNLPSADHTLAQPASETATSIPFAKISHQWEFLHHIPRSASRKKLPPHRSHCFGIMAGSKAGRKKAGKERMWEGLRGGREKGQADDPHISSTTFFSRVRLRPIGRREESGLVLYRTWPL